MAESWLEKVGGIEQIVSDLQSKYDVGTVCSGDVYQTVQAMMALAVNQAVEEAGFTPRKKKRVVNKMANWLMNGAVAVFMLGYDAAKRAEIRPINVVNSDEQKALDFLTERGYDLMIVGHPDA